MAIVDVNYHNLLKEILHNGYDYDDPNRTGVVRKELLNYTFRHEFKDGFPAITTKKLNYKSVVTELIWFLRGDTNIKYLVDKGCNIWNKDAYNYYKKIHNDWDEKYLMSLDEFIMCIKFSKKELNEYLNKSGQGFKKIYNLGDLGPVYGHQWRNFTTCEENIELFDDDYPPSYYKTGIDQIQRLITNLKKKPLATDHIVNSWNVGDLKNMALPPCHYGFQVIVRPLSFNERLDIANTFNTPRFIAGENALTQLMNDLNIPEYGFELHWQQRSVDTFLGLPFNIASYATLALILEKITGYKALAIQGDLKKVHLYDNSLDAVKEQLSRNVDKYDKCELRMDVLTEVQFEKDIKHINEIEPGSFKLENYKSYPGIRVEMLERDE